ncbi:gluzincin family metallopeptidase [Defluviitoga tunisiensis]|uniref:Peptidase M3A and M3B thimet/oligopeptidase F n=1 Tax=Defluviitoga tunisiensis TaxID=1006576 RepID=A0A0C7NW36_DEFTU|nr:M3 family metallopeptidase [Defluviitoga tunisiensis]MDD3601648.1 M3 family metallopeptidase [Defluviitoga tunisiensis]CEP77673.1 peptidase M3A and M3B thimet/oligopeptidase F [Defluviitoga tunisiensis]
MDIEQVVNLFQKLNKKEIKASKLGWTQYTTGFDLGIEQAYQDITAFLEDEENFRIVCKHKEKELNTIDKRRMEIAYNIFEPFHKNKLINELNLKIRRKTNELSQILNTYRFTIDGKEVTSVEIDQLLTNEDRNLRKKAYFSRNQINKVLIDNGFIELINLRKELAKAEGSMDFVEYMLKKDELSPNIFNGWKDELKNHINKLNNKRKELAKNYIDADELKPWDEEYLKNIISPSLNTKVDMTNYYFVLRDFFLNFGINMDKYNITYDIFPRKNKSEWGYNFRIEVGKDSRVLANVKNRYSEYKTLLHESGHAIHSFLQDPNEIILNEGISGIVTEGIANLFGSFIYDKLFYKYFFDDSVENEFNKIKEYEKLNYLRFIGNIFFDHELYRNNITSLEDIYDIYYKVYKDLFGDKPLEEEPPFGYRIHYTTHPIYMHNYFMGDVTCEMLRKVFCEKQSVDNITEKPTEFIQFLIEDVIKPSGLYKYEELFEKISGEPFSLKWYF